MAEWEYATVELVDVNVTEKWRDKPNNVNIYRAWIVTTHRGLSDGLTAVRNKWDGEITDINYEGNEQGEIHNLIAYCFIRLEINAPLEVVQAAGMEGWEMTHGLPVDYDQHGRQLRISQMRRRVG